MSSEKMMEATPMTRVALSLPMAMEHIVRLKFSDGRTIDLDDATAFMSRRLKFSVTRRRRMMGINFMIVSLERYPEFRRIPFELVEKVFDYCRRHAHASPDDDLLAFDYQHEDAFELCRLSIGALRFGVDGLFDIAWSVAIAVLSRTMPQPEATYHKYTDIIFQEF